MHIVKMITNKFLVLALLGAVALLGSGCMVVPYGYGYHGHHGSHGYHNYHGYHDGYRSYRYR